MILTAKPPEIKTQPKSSVHALDGTAGQRRHAVPSGKHLDIKDRSVNNNNSLF